MQRSLKIALAFVGILVGAGFATGAEVIQYFISFGAVGLLGAALAGVVMAVAGAIVVQLGSHFLADDHKVVFRSVAHPVVARFLDVSVTVTLFAMGFVMLAGAGSTLHQQLGWPTWVGAALMTVLVIVTGLLDVDRVSAIISWVTPLVIIAVVVGFVVALVQFPADPASISALAAQAPSPVSPWWLSALNYVGLALLMAVSMSLVIGGSHANSKDALVGGIAGGVLYLVLLMMAAVLLYLEYPAIGDADVPMLALFASLSDWMPWVMVFIIYAMIYNTAIAMLYALGRRLSADRPQRYRPVFIGVTLLAFAVSFAGFGSLMSVVYPLIGWVGMAMVAVLLGWWLRHRGEVAEEMRLRYRMRALLGLKRHPDREFTPGHAAMLQEAAADSVAPGQALTGAIDAEAIAALRAEDVLPETDGAAPPEAHGSTAR